MDEMDEIQVSKCCFEIFVMIFYPPYLIFRNYVSFLSRIRLAKNYASWNIKKKLGRRSVPEVTGDCLKIRSGSLVGTLNYVWKLGMQIEIHHFDLATRYKSPVVSRFQIFASAIGQCFSGLNPVQRFFFILKVLKEN